MADRMRPVIIESPFAGCVPLNRAYLQAAIRDCLRRGETPYASHQMLTWALDDDKPEERELGISAGLEMRNFLDAECGAASVFYVDLGWSPGMERAKAGCAWITRSIVDPWEWNRIGREACFDERFKTVALEVVPAMPWNPMGDVLRTRDIYLAQKARVA